MIQYKVKVGEYSTEWYLNDLLHRVDGPALEYADGSKEWYLNGYWHRVDGPAIEYTNGHKAWFLDGKKYSEKEFLEKTQPAKELSVAQLEALLGFKVKIVK